MSIGPLTVLSTIISSILCCSCLIMKINFKNKNYDEIIEKLQGFFSNCMSSWGLFWMVILFFLPLFIILAIGALISAIIFLFLLYPFYCIIRYVSFVYNYYDDAN